MPIGVRVPSWPSTLNPRWMTCTTSRSWGMAIARAWSSARETSVASITPPGTATTPRLLIEETCPPARLTSAELISIPEVCSACSTERVMACDARPRSTMTPRRMPSDGSIPTPMMRMVFSPSTRPTRVQTLVVPTSMPTTISSMLLRRPVVGRLRVFDADECRLHALRIDHSDHGVVDFKLERHISRPFPEVHLPASAVFPSQAVLSVENEARPARRMRGQCQHSLHQFLRNEGSGRQRIRGCGRDWNRGILRLHRNESICRPARPEGDAALIDPCVAAILGPHDDRGAFPHSHRHRVRQPDTHVGFQEFWEVQAQELLQVTRNELEDLQSGAGHHSADLFGRDACISADLWHRGPEEGGGCRQVQCRAENQ